MSQTPLKLSVNLYSKSLLPKKLRLSFYRLISALVLISAASALYSGFSYFEQSKLETQLAKSKAQLESENKQQEALKSSLAQHNPKAELLEQVSQGQHRLALTQKLLTKVGNSSQYQSKSYQMILEDLAQTADGSTWLTHIAVNGEHINLSGETQNASAVPAWIKRLSETRSLAGKGFNQLLVNRGDNNLLQFEVNSKAQTEGEVK